jgi:hypothetical protein
VPAAWLSTEEGQHVTSAVLIPPAVQSASDLHSRVLDMSVNCFGKQADGELVQ